MTQKDAIVKAFQNGTDINASVKDVAASIKRKTGKHVSPHAISTIRQQILRGELPGVQDRGVNSLGTDEVPITSNFQNYMKIKKLAKEIGGLELLAQLTTELSELHK